MKVTDVKSQMIVVEFESPRCTLGIVRGKIRSHVGSYTPAQKKKAIKTYYAIQSN